VRKKNEKCTLKLTTITPHRPGAGHLTSLFFCTKIAKYVLVHKTIKIIHLTEK